MAVSMIAFLSVAGLTTGEPNEPGEEELEPYVPLQFIAEGGWLPAPGESSTARVSDLEESLFATYSFDDRGAAYSLEFYYRPLYSRLRVRVLVDNRELHGIFNRFYGFNARGRSMLSVTRSKDGSPAVYLNPGILVLKDSDINMDAIYDAMEDFLSRSNVPRNYVSVYITPPPGLLRRTCQARIMGLKVLDYLISEDGQVEPLTIESLCAAYNREGIKAKNADDYKGIAWSIIASAHESTSRDKIVLISSVNEIPGDASGELDPRKEAEVREPQIRRNADAHADYWTCSTYARFHGVVARYTFGFHDGRLQSAEGLVLGEGIGDASYLGAELQRASGGSASLPVRSSSARPHRLPFGVVSAGIGALLLLCAFLIHRRRGIG